MDSHNEISRIVNLRQLCKKSFHYSFKATQDELLALARRLNIVAVKSFKAAYAIKENLTQKSYALTAHLEAEVVQQCVSTFAEVPEQIDVCFNLYMIDGKNQDNSFKATIDDDDDVEFSLNGTIDLGEIAAQYLSLNLEPYPRSVDCQDEQSLLKDRKLSESSHPFSVLKFLKT